MLEYTVKVKQILLQMLAWGLTAAVGLFACGLAELIPGLWTGVAVSCIYFLSMCYRIKKSGDMPVRKAITYMRTGWLLRLAFIVMMLIISLHIPWIDFWAAVAGLFTLHIIGMINAVGFALRSVWQNGR